MKKAYTVTHITMPARKLNNLRATGFVMMVLNHDSAGFGVLDTLGATNTGLASAFTAR
jgi:hypothetical protein